MTEKIKLREKIAYGFGDAASSMCWKIFGMYALFFYTDVFGITAKAAALMFLIARLWDSFFDVIVGVLADRTRSRFGKYRPYLLWFAVPFAAMGAITFFTPDFADSGKLVYAYVTYSLMMLVYSAINVPYASLLGAISSDPAERNSLSSFRMSFAFIGSFVTFMLLQPLIDFFAGTFDPAGFAAKAENSVSTVPAAWAMGVGVIGIICIVLFLLCFAGTKERVQQIEKEENVSLKTDLKNLFRNTTWWILVGTGLAALFFNALRDSVAIYYFRDYVSASYKMTGTGWDMTTIYFLVGQAANLLGVMAAPVLSARFGKKRTYMIAMLTAGVLSVLFYFVPKEIACILGMQFLISVFAGYILPLLWSMFADIVDDQELKTGRRTSGLIFSSSSMSQKLGWALGASLGGWILAGFGYNEEAVKQGLEVAQSVITGERLMLTVFPAICCALAFIGMMFYPLSDKKVKENTVELERRRKQS
ncbi:MAG: MFS transporter [Dysgonamonadaceae bacterium]|jgi:GPH family glycoside/pentoside/hexuronide:cation symporter|nr:MFS transporter [Dysgonamonadaceae bacterium]